MFIIASILLLSLLIGFGDAFHLIRRGNGYWRETVFAVLFDEEEITFVIFILIAVALTVAIGIYRKKSSSPNKNVVLGGLVFCTVLVFISSIYAFLCSFGAGSYLGWGIITYAIAHLLIGIGYIILIITEYRNISEAEDLRYVKEMEKEEKENK